MSIIGSASGYDLRTVTVAATQMSCRNQEENIKKAESLVRIAHGRGAQIVLLQELFQHTYFPIELSSQNFQLAETLEGSGIIRGTFNQFENVSDGIGIPGMQALAKELRVVLPISFFERYQNSYYNSVAVIDADGSILGVVRKAHISDRLGYNDKYYFAPSDTPATVFQTRYATIGVGIGSDQWYPEAARLMAIKGAEIIFFPSALGSNQYDPSFDPRDQWQRVMQGHAAANMVPVIASNRVGTEQSDGVQVTFCGSSFITGQTGELLKIADRESEGVLVEVFHLEKMHIRRASWGLLRDRRPALYDQLATRDGTK
ncbi:N-carbamoylputrescine amidase [Achlya hypogyna]|uniref:N-carbamoylputrescine amidase n=1 Tax=Achlya hypogyna TaxID=1202772 RepID=A0A1V9Z3M5_ACHHY|nr:N-carbamoylputrescine amidase [Achlya hypogyna]